MTSVISAKKHKRKEELTQDLVLSVFNTHSDRMMTQVKKCDLQNKNQIDSIYKKKDIKEYSFIACNGKDKQSKNAASKENKRRPRRHDNVENLKSSHDSKWNKMPLTKPLLSSTRLHENTQQVQTVTNTKQSQNPGTSKLKSESFGRYLIEVNDTPKTGLDQLNNELTKKSFTHSAFSLSDMNDLGSLRNTQDLYMQVEQAICEGRSNEQNNLMQAGVNQVKPSNTIVDIPDNSGQSALRDMYLELSEFSSMPESQEIFNWIKNSDLEESASLNRLLDLNHDDFSHAKLKQTLKDIKNKNKIMELIGKKRKGNAQEKCTDTTNILPQNTDSQELNLINDELANFLNIRTKSITDTSLVCAGKEGNCLQQNIETVTNIKDNNNRAISDKALFEPPKPPSNSSYSQECAIEDLTNNSIKKSSHGKKTGSSNVKTNILNPLIIQINQEKELPVKESKKPRKKLYSAESAVFLNSSVQNLNQSIKYEEKGLTQKFVNTKYGATSQNIKRFSATETKTLLQLLKENDRYKKINTKTFWQEVAVLWRKKNLMTPKLSLNARNSVSLRKHYYRRILPNINKFDLSPEKIRSLQHYSKNN